MSSTYSSVYIDLNTGKEYYLDQAIDSPYALVKYIQSEAGYVWTINHNKNSDKVIVQVNGGFDLPETEIIDGNTIQLTFSEPVAGQAILIFFDQGTVFPNTPSPTPSITVSASVGVTPTPTATPSPTASASAEVTPTPSVTVSASLALSPTATATVTPTPTPSITLSRSPIGPSATPTPTLTPSVSSSPTFHLATVTPTPTPTLTPNNGTPFLARMSLGGSPDNSYPNQNLDASVNSMVTTDDNKLMVVGNFTTIGGYSYSYVARLNSDGSVDTTFGNLGLYMPDDNGMNIIIKAADGSFYVGGSFVIQKGAASYNGLIRLNSDGTFDDTFVCPDVTYQGSSGSCFALMQAANGKIYAGGWIDSLNGSPHSSMYRLNSDGTLDNTFTPLVGLSTSLAAVVATQAFDGHIYVGSTQFATAAGEKQLLRMSATGVEDMAYGQEMGDGVWMIKQVSTGPIYIGGSFTGFNGYNYFARLNSDGSVDTTFTDLAITDPSFVQVSGLLETTGGTYVYGYFTTPQAYSFRLTDTGVYDSSYTAPAIDNTFNTMNVFNALIYVGGFFSNFK